MNLIFLDVDGVINSIDNLIRVYAQTKKTMSGYNYPFDEDCLSNLRDLVFSTNSKLVISSSWRNDEKGLNVLMEKLKEYDLDKEVIGCTRVINQNRFLEIKDYLSSFDYEINFIILDDDLILGYEDRLVKTDTKMGLTKENVNKVKMLLKRLI